jgi:hypothetical protein
MSVDVFNLAARLDPARVQHLVLAGGLPRSGTTFAEAVVDAHPQVLSFDEYMPLKSSEFAHFLRFFADLTAAERRVWVDAGGNNWRGYSADEERSRFLRFLITSFAATTRHERIAAKSPSQVRVLFCKTPSCEVPLTVLADALARSPGGGLPLRYVHCVREPLACARSNWDMPWVPEMPLRTWVAGFANMLGASLAGYRAIVAAGIPAHVLRSDRLWQGSSRPGELAALADFLGIAPTGRQEEIAAGARVDPWPQERRRQPAEAFDEEIARLFDEQPAVIAWREAFGFPAGSGCVPA